MTSTLPSGFEDFKAAHSQSVPADGISKIDLSAQFDIAVMPAQDGRFTVEVDAHEDDAKKYKIETDGNVLKLSDKGIVGNFGSMSVSKGFFGSVTVSNMRTTGSVFINNGRVVINGVEQTADNSDKETHPVPRVVVYVPGKPDLRANVDGQASLSAQVPFGATNIDLSGQAKGQLTADSLKADQSGQSELDATVNGGEAVIHSSGQSEAALKGTFKSVTAKTSGQSEIKTSGFVAGDYDADASGQSEIRHRGTIGGHRREKEGFMATIKLG